MLQGIDVSHHQGPHINFEEVADAGYAFAIIKATEGRDYEDPNFSTNWDKLVDLGAERLIRGAYHFARPYLRPYWGRSAGELEGRWFASVMNRKPAFAGCLPLWLDWEKYTGTPGDDSEQVSRNAQWIEGFIHVVRQETGQDVGIYTGRNVWEGTLRNLGDAFIDQPLWQVQYSAQGAVADAQPSRMPKRESLIPWPWVFWQWSGGGSFAHGPQVPGIPRAGASAVVDINRFDGSLDDLRSLAGLDVLQPEPLPALGGPIMGPFDLGDLPSSVYAPSVALVQGLLLAQGANPSGLVGSDGRPDGKPGSRTQDALRRFQRARATTDPELWVGPSTWHALLQLPKT